MNRKIVFLFLFCIIFNLIAVSCQSCPTGGTKLTAASLNAVKKRKFIEFFSILIQQFVRISQPTLFIT